MQFVPLVGINPHFPTALHVFGLNICILSVLSACVQVSLFLVLVNREKKEESKNALVLA